MLSLYEILKASKTGIAPDMWTALAGMNWGGADSGAEVKELTGIPPLSFTADGTPLLDYLISGNMVQTGTPTPQNPIQPSETGDLSENLYDASNPNIYKGYYNTTTNSLVGTPNNAFIYIPLVQGKKYYIYGAKRYNASTTLRWVTTPSTPSYTAPCIRTGAFAQTDIFTITAETNENYLAIFLCGDSDYSAYGTVEDAIATNGANLTIDNGYKIPILSANITTNVHLGEVPTTRKIKKLVLTGEETFTYYNTKSGKNVMNLSVPDSLGVFAGNGLVFCTHLPRCNQDEIYSETVERGISTRPSSRILFYDTVIANTPAGFKSYLAAQYAAGTPVTVWYVLTTPEIGIVNEPLRKIGDYADTVSMEQAQVQIPTLHGNTVIDVLTELKPSEMYIKYQK